MDKKFHHLMRERTEIAVRYDGITEAIWCYSKPSSQPFFTVEILTQYKEFQEELVEYFENSEFQPKTPIKYLVNASLTSNVFNYGGDLKFLTKLLIEKNRKKFFDYAKLIVDVTYLNYVNLNLPITTISLVEGDALGGGLISAISTEFCIVEEQSRMGFPGKRFNLMPGISGYSLLARLVNTEEADKMIANGKIYDSSALLEKGVVTQVVKQGEGEEAIKSFIKKHRQRAVHNKERHLSRKINQSVEYDELIHSAEKWIDRVMKLNVEDFKAIEKIIEAQDQKDTGQSFGLRAKQNRRFDKLELEFPFKTADGRVVTENRRGSRDPRDV